MSTSASSGKHRQQTPHSAERTKRRKRSRLSDLHAGYDSAHQKDQIRPFSLAFFTYLYTFFKRQISRALHSSWLLALPLFIYSLSTTIDYLVIQNAFDAADFLFFSNLPNSIEDPRRAAAEEIKKIVQAGIYLLAFGLALLHWRAVYAYFRRWPHLIMILVALVAGATYSIAPIKVVTNTILILISILIAVLFATGQQEENRYQNFYLVVLVPLFMLHMASFLLLFTYDINILDFLFSPLRYGGLAGAPNALGGLAVLGIWAASSIVFSSNASGYRRVFAGFSIAPFLFSIAVSGSGTALATVIVLAAIMLWMRLLAAVKPTVRLLMNSALLVLAIILALALVIVSNSAELFLLFTESLGKDASLTGRTELWDIAREAIALRPWLGWSFDAHESVKSMPAFNVRFNHYHNGFLDTLVAGGVVLFSLVIYNLAPFRTRIHCGV